MNVSLLAEFTPHPEKINMKVSLGVGFNSQTALPTTYVAMKSSVSCLLIKEVRSKNEKKRICQDRRG